MSGERKGSAAENFGARASAMFEFVNKEITACQQGKKKGVDPTADGILSIGKVINSVAYPAGVAEESVVEVRQRVQTRALSEIFDIIQKSVKEGKSPRRSTETHAEYIMLGQAIGELFDKRLQYPHELKKTPSSDVELQSPTARGPRGSVR